MGKELEKISKEKVNEFGLALNEDLKKWELLATPEERELVSTAFKEAEFLPTGMTGFQIKNFVLSDQNFPTPDSKFWQCRLEMWSRMQSVMGQYFNFRKTQAELEILEGQYEEWEENLEANTKIRRGNMRKLEVEMQEKEFHLFTIGKSTTEALRELSVYKEEFERLKEHIKHNPQDKESQELDFWIAKAQNDDRLKVMVNANC